MQEPPSIIKAINSLKAASFVDPITRIHLSAQIWQSASSQRLCDADTLVKECQCGVLPPKPKQRSARLEKSRGQRRGSTLTPTLATLPPRLRTLDDD